MSEALIRWRPPSRRRRAVLGVAGIAALFLGWQVIGRFGLIGDSFPAPTALIAGLDTAGQRRVLIRSLAATGQVALFGFVLGVAVGAVLGVLPALLPRLAPYLDRFATIVHVLPVIALTPLLFTLVDRNNLPVVMSAWFVFFYITVAVGAGIKAVPPSHAALFKALGASRRMTFLRMRVPHALPFLADGLRLAAPAALLGAVFGEWFGAERGLGVLLVTAMQEFRIEQLWLAATIVTVLSLLCALIFGALGTWIRARFT